MKIILPSQTFFEMRSAYRNPGSCFYNFFQNIDNDLLH